MALTVSHKRRHGGPGPLWRPAPRAASPSKEALTRNSAKPRRSRIPRRPRSAPVTGGERPLPRPPQPERPGGACSTAFAAVRHRPSTQRSSRQHHREGGSAPSLRRHARTPFAFRQHRLDLLASARAATATAPPSARTTRPYAQRRVMGAGDTYVPHLARALGDVPYAALLYLARGSPSTTVDVAAHHDGVLLQINCASASDHSRCALLLYTFASGES